MKHIHDLQIEEKVALKQVEGSNKTLEKIQTDILTKEEKISKIQETLQNLQQQEHGETKQINEKIKKIMSDYNAENRKLQQLQQTFLDEAQKFEDAKEQYETQLNERKNEQLHKTHSYNEILITIYDPFVSFSSYDPHDLK